MKPIVKPILKSCLSYFGVLFLIGCVTPTKASMTLLDLALILRKTGYDSASSVVEKSLVSESVRLIWNEATHDQEVVNTYGAVCDLKRKHGYDVWELNTLIREHEICLIRALGIEIEEDQHFGRF